MQMKLNEPSDKPATTVKSRTRWVATALAVALAATMGAGSAWADKGGNGHGPYELPPGQAKKLHKESHKVERRHDEPRHARLAVPAAYIPAPGMCRIWYPGRAHSKQPKARPCHVVMGHVPVGAWLVTREPSHHHEVYVTQPDRHRSGVMIDVGVYDAVTGSYLRLGINN